MSETVDLRFACLIMPGQLEKQALLFARSIRTFGGRFKSSTITMVTPQQPDSISRSVQDELRYLQVELCDIEIAEPILAFPFGAKVMAAAKAENVTSRNSELLVWMDTDSILIQEPEALILPKDKILGFRPVDHTLIASRFEAPIDDFWHLIYGKFGISKETVYPMVTSVDQVTIRPYFNAGMLVVRPDAALLENWSTAFARCFDDEDFSFYYRQNVMYKIFFHQAVLAAVILSTVNEEELYQLPHRVNYPLHLHAEYPSDLKAESMNDLVSCRYDTAFQDEKWREGIRVKGHLRQWLMIQENELYRGGKR